MKRHVFAILVVLAAVVWGFGQRRPLPAFAQFPAAVERARARKIDFAHSPGAGTFRTRLNFALCDGVNFAGHYILTGWGCGTGCIYGAIIDTRNGRVYFPEVLAGMATGYTDNGGYVDEPMGRKKSSRLLIINGVPGSQHENAPELLQGKYYYEWANNRLRLLRSVKSNTK